MNPIVALRKELRITQKELAEQAHITEQVVLKAEQGLYPTLPPSLLRMVSQLSELAPGLIEANYEAWINEELKKTKLPSVGNQMVTNPVNFKEWRQKVCELNDVPNSVNGLCKLLKIHPYVIQKYESGRMKGVPIQLIERIAYIKGGLS